MTGDPNEVAELLNRRRSIIIDNQPVPEALKALADQTDIDGVYFPYELDANRRLDPNVRIKISGTMTVAEALDDISRQVTWPEMEWTTCETFGTVLFPKGHDAFPLVADVTQPLSRLEMAEDPLYGAAIRVQQGGLLPLYQAAFRVAPLVPSERVRLEVGADGDLMEVLSDPQMVPRLQQIMTMPNIPPQQRAMMLEMVRQGVRGYLLWRPIDVQPEAVPEEMTTELAAQVRRDFKLVRAFEKARQAALEIDSIEKFTDALDTYDYADTGLLSRNEFMSANLEIVSVPTSPQISATLRQRLAEQAFSSTLLPADPNGPFDEKSPTLLVMRVPETLHVAVLRRIGYEPLVLDEYTEVRPQFYASLLDEQRRITLQRWVLGVRQRMDFQFTGQ
jgi:hypothetical protein